MKLTFSFQYSEKNFPSKYLESQKLVSQRLPPIIPGKGGAGAGAARNGRTDGKN